MKKILLMCVLLLLAGCADMLAPNAYSSYGPVPAYGPGFEFGGFGGMDEGYGGMDDGGFGGFGDGGFGGMDDD